MTLPHTTCDECGRPMQKAQAIRNGRAYCATCHKRLSRPAECRECGRGIRIHTGDEPLCKSCKNAGRSCVRCGKPVTKAGLTLEQGVACGSCARYFKVPLPCSNCGELSIHLSRDTRLGFDKPACPKCRRTGHATCASCGKHRLPAGLDGQGRPLCAPCLQRGTTPYVCLVCGKPGGRHSSGRCDECYWSGRLERKAVSLAATLDTPAVKTALTGYIEYAGIRSGNKKVALGIERQMEFFRALDRDPRLLNEPAAMVERFGGEGLRRHAIPYAALIARGVMAGMVKVSFAGRISIIRAIHLYTISQLANIPGGSATCQARIKDNFDGVTGQLSIEVPIAALDNLFGPGWLPAEAGLQATGNSPGADMAASSPRFDIRYRN